MISPAMSRAAALAVNQDRPGLAAMQAIWKAAREADGDGDFARRVAPVLPSLAGGG
jgi:hypothetical protein